MGRRRERSEAEERAQFGGYSAAELDAEFVRTQRSDWGHVLYRAAMLAVVYATLARGIAYEGLTAGFLLLPMALEYLLVMWLGLYLSRRVVSCTRFAKSASSVGLVLFWSLLILAIGIAVLAWDEEARAFRGALIGPAFVEGWSTVVDSGLVWALLVMAGSLGWSTAQEVARWKRVGGVFVWTSITDLGMRIGVSILLLVFGGIALGVLAGPWLEWLLQAGPRRAWFTFAVLLLIEALALLVGVLMHRDLSRNARAARG